MESMFLEFLGDCGLVKTYQKNEVVHLDFVEPRNIFLIHEGLVKHVVSDEEGREKTLMFLKRGDIFGEVSFFQQAENYVLTQTIKPSKIASISAEEFESKLEEFPELYKEVTYLVTRKIRIIISQVKDMSFLSVEGRLINLLLRLASQHGFKTTTGEIVIDLETTHQDIANMIVAYRSTVSKIMRRLITCELISVKEKQIIILDHGRLCNLFAEITSRSC